MLDAYSQLIQIYDRYMETFGPTNVPSSSDVILPPVFYNKVRHTEKQPVYIVDIDENGCGSRPEPAKEVHDDIYHSTLCPSTLSQRINGANGTNKEFQFFTKMGILANEKTKQIWLSLYSSWVEQREEARIIKPILEYVEKTDFSLLLLEKLDPYLIFHVNGINIFVNNVELYNSYVSFYVEHLMTKSEYYAESCHDWLSDTDGLLVLSGKKEFLSFGLNYANQAKLITKTQTTSTLENHNVFPTTKRNFSSFTLSVENNLKIALSFDYLCEIKKQFGDTRRLAFLDPSNVSFRQFLTFNDRFAREIERYALMRISHSDVLEDCKNMPITILEWKQNDPAKSSIIKCEAVKVADYVHNINFFIAFISDYINGFISRIKNSKNKIPDALPTFTMSNLLGNFYLRGTAIMSKRIESVYDDVVHGRPINRSILKEMQRYIVKMIQSQSLSQIQRHYKGYKNTRSYILDSLELLAGMIEYNKSFDEEKSMEEDRSYIYGQILAVYQKIEEVVQWNTNGSNRPTIVEKNLSNFINNPNKYFLLIVQRMTPYLLKFHGGYKKALDELYAKLPYVGTEGISNNNMVITSNFLLGYYHQLNDMRGKHTDNSDVNEKENENE